VTQRPWTELQHAERLTESEESSAHASRHAGCVPGSSRSTRRPARNLINPECIVVGWELEAAGELLLAPIRAALGRSAIPSAAKDVAVVPVSSGNAQSARARSRSFSATAGFRPPASKAARRRLHSALRSSQSASFGCRTRARPSR
jgi:hypothetical protein